MSGASAYWYYRPADPDRQQLLAALARALREAASGQLEGVLEAVPGYTALYVEYDPQALPLAALQQWVNDWQPQEQAARSAVRIPVVYDGEDLPEVAQRAGLSVQQAIDLHTSATYHVRALGFVAGFPFMETTPPPLQAPRRASPRPKVSAHSLAVAGAQTGIYPVEAPGGWNLLGHTLVALYDPHAPQPFLLEPGDQVQFLPTEGEVPPALSPLSLLPDSPRLPVLQVQRPGLQDLVMDGGRVGSAHHGLVRSGVQDAQAAAIAAQLLGNPPHSALLEMPLKGPTLRVLSTATLACTGGLVAVVNGQEQLPYSSFEVQSGDVLSFRPGRGRIGYLALCGGLETVPFLGSSSSDLKAGLGRPLQAGDLLGAQSEHKRLARQFVPYWVTAPLRTVPLRLLPLAADSRIDPVDLAALCARPYTLRDLDRMAARLSGEALAGGEIRSEASPVGTVQIPPSGEPMILLQDKGTMGGYRTPARVHPADLPRLAQSLPGSKVQFIAALAE